MTRTLPFQTIVDALLEKDRPFPKKYLSYFSDIDPASLELLLEAWPRIALTRKRILLDELDALLDEDTIVSFDDFARALLNDPDAPVRAGAIRLLAECEDIKLVPVYEKLVTGDSDAEVRAEAASTLNLFVDLGELEEIPQAAARRAEDALFAAIHDENAEVRHRALESLGYSSRPEVPPLIEAAYDRADPDWLVSALVAMGRSSDERWSGQVVHMLLNDHPDVRLAAVKAAGEISLPDARLPLLRLLEDEDDSAIFSAAIWSLSQIGGEDVRDYFLSLLDQTEEEDALDFIEDALANLSFTEDLEKFDLLALDPDEDLLDMEELDALDDDDDDEEEEDAPALEEKPSKTRKTTTKTKK